MAAQPVFTSTEALILRAAANLLRTKGEAITAEHDALSTTPGYAGGVAVEAASSVDEALRELYLAGLIEGAA